MTLCLQGLSDGDTLLLIQDGVLVPKLQLQGIDASAVVYLADDCEARGQKAGAARQVTYDGFVELCEQHDRVINWNCP